VLVGINLLREGLDLPEVSTVAILDADKEGFLRSETALIQVIGRTARNVNAKVFLYGDRITRSMQKAIDETERRRKIQLEYNKKHNITPKTIVKGIRESLASQIKARQTAQRAIKLSESEYDNAQHVNEIEQDMLEAAEELDFERAAFLRDQLKELKELPRLIISASKDKRDHNKGQRK
jgi:excinuclease ABC subunit B